MGRSCTGCSGKPRRKPSARLPRSLLFGWITPLLHQPRHWFVLCARNPWFGAPPNVAPTPSMSSGAAPAIRPAVARARSTDSRTTMALPDGLYDLLLTGGLVRSRADLDPSRV